MAQSLQKQGGHFHFISDLIMGIVIRNKPEIRRTATYNHIN